MNNQHKRISVPGMALVGLTFVLLLAGLFFIPKTTAVQQKAPVPIPAKLTPTEVSKLSAQAAMSCPYLAGTMSASGVTKTTAGKTGASTSKTNKLAPASASTGQCPYLSGKGGASAATAPAPDKSADAAACPYLSGKSGSSASSNGDQSTEKALTALLKARDGSTSQPVVKASASARH